MREIKFRAFWKDTLKPLDIMCDESIEMLRSELIHLVQFTGLKDKNSQEIYEGDLLSMSYGIPVVYDECKVLFVDAAFYVLTPKHNPQDILLSEFLDIFPESGVIGNIYEHKHLLDNDENCDTIKE